MLPTLPIADTPSPIRSALIDYDREMALLAVVSERNQDDIGKVVESERVIGVSRYITNPDQAGCEFALVVADNSPAGVRLQNALSSSRESRMQGEVHR